MKGLSCRESHPLYQQWHWVIRCYTATRMVEERWLDFWKFVEDVKEHPGKEFLFHRVYFDKPYGPKNYRWRKKTVLNPEITAKRTAYMRNWKKQKLISEPDYERDISLRKQFGITIHKYNEMLTAQNGTCAICFGTEKSVAHTSKKRRNLTVDHCHKTGKVRGLLCSCCNRGIGSFYDEINRLKSAIAYLGG